MAAVTDTFKAGVTAGSGVYGVPVGNAMGGGVLYNKKVYEQLGLEVPKTWAEFMANSETIKARRAGRPVIQTYGADSTWTSQLFVLGDFYNVEAADPGWADKFTANQAHFADTPAAQRGLRPPAGGVRGRLPQRGLRLGDLRRRRSRRSPPARARTTRCSRSRSLRSRATSRTTCNDSASSPSRATTPTTRA